MKKRINQGFTLVEMVIVVSIFAILLGIMVPSLNSLLGFEAQRATNSIAAALDKTKIEAMSRLVGEMELKYQDGKYVVTYYVDRGKGRGLEPDRQPDDEIAKGNVKITYFSKSSPEGTDLKTKPLILTFDRETGGFKEIQADYVTKKELENFLSKASKENFHDLQFHDSGEYCERIVIECGLRSRTINLNIATGSYTIRAN